MLSGIPVDPHVRNDPKVRALRAKYQSAGLGNLLALWSYVATEGSQDDPGYGVDPDGTPLDVTLMSRDLGFPTAIAFREFLTFLASIGLIDAGAWATDIVHVRSWKRFADQGRKSNGYIPTGRPPGRPRKPANQGTREPGTETPETPCNPVKPHAQSIVVSLPGTKIPETPCNPESPDSAKKPAKCTADETPCNPVKPHVTPCGGGLLLSSTYKDPSTSTESIPGVLEPEDLILDGTSPPTQDPRTGRLTVAKVIALWNQVREPGPKILEAKGARYERFRLAVKASPNVADWERAIVYLNSQPWANAGGTNGHENYRADLDYLAKPGKVTKCLESRAAADLPRMKVGAAAGRIMNSPERAAEGREARRQRDAAQDAELKAAGLL